MAQADQRDLLSRIAVPTLLIWGELDARSPLSVAPQFEQAIPHTKLVVIPGARSRRQLRAARAVQRGRARVLSCRPPALALKPAAASLGGAGLKSPCQRTCGPLDRRLRSRPLPHGSLEPPEQALIAAGSPLRGPVPTAPWRREGRFAGLVDRWASRPLPDQCRRVSAQARDAREGRPPSVSTDDELALAPSGGCGSLDAGPVTPADRPERPPGRNGWGRPRL
jgi:hypothetical protein